MTLIISGCTEHYESSEFDLKLIQKAFNELKLISKDYEQSIPKSKWPSYLQVIDAKSVHFNERGIFIELEHFFVEESGLYSPFDTGSDASQIGKDPEIIRLTKSVYSYNIKG